MNIFSKAYIVFKNYLEGWKVHQENKKRAKETELLRKVRKSDIDRWGKKEEFHKNWNERTAIIASMIPEQSNVIEFGAGDMELRKLLSAGSKYTPTDILERFPGMMVCDLNEKISINLEAYDTAVFSGVLEYVYNVEKVITQLKDEIKHVILSYACSDISNAPRLERGWLSDFTKAELEDIFKKNNFKVVEYQEWRKQSIFHLRNTK